MRKSQRQAPRLLRGYSVQRVALALLLPLPAAAIQWLLFPYIYPSVWIVFYPVLFLSSWLAGFIGGVGSALVSTALVYGLFIGPASDWVVGANRILPTAIFVGMGILFGEVHERLARVQRQLAEERDTTEAKFEGLVEQSLAGIYVAENGVITYANPEFARIFGYENAEALVGQPATELITSSYASPSGASDGREQTDMSGLRSETLGLRQDGLVVPIDIHGRTIATEGRYMTIGVVIDRTEVLEARDLIRQRDEMLARTSEIGRIGGWQLNPLTGEATWTAEAARIYGFDPDNAPQLSSPSQWVAPEWQAMIEASYRHVLVEGEPFDLEAEIVTAQGSRKWVRIVGRPVKMGGQVVNVQGTIQDVTDRHDAEQALRRSEERFRTLVEQMPDGMVVLDETGHVVDANQAACDMVGYSRDEIRRLEFAAFVRPSDRVSMRDRIRNIGDSARTSEWILVRKDGSEFHAEITGRRLPEGGAQGVVRDVTDRRRAEQLIRELNSELERKVAMRTAEVVAANRELEAFAHAVSHDLRAPLRAMSGFCRALEEDYGAALDDTAREYIGYIIEGSRAMGDLIDALLILSRDTRGEMLHETVDVTELAEKAFEQRRQLYPNRDVEVVIEPEMYVYGDTRMVRVLVANLVSNAWKYTMKTDDARIELSSSVDSAGRRWINVADNGAGFDIRYANQLFEPFHRLHREDDFPGIGIGLATVKRIVNRHAGQIRAQAEVGQGATFSFWLPGPDELLEGMFATVDEAVEHQT